MPFINTMPLVVSFPDSLKNEMKRGNCWALQQPLHLDLHLPQVCRLHHQRHHLRHR